MENNASVPMLVPIEPALFWQQIRLIIREEIARIEKPRPIETTSFSTPGLTYKPLYKMAEVCALFNITRPTIYDWIRHGKLKPVKIRSRVYFLWNDIQELMGEGRNELNKLRA